MRRRQFIALAGTTTVAIAGCSEDQEGEPESGSTNGDGSSSNGDGSGGNGDSSDQPVQILNHEWYEEDFSAGVRGQLENVSGEELSYVEVEVAFLDSDGVQLEDGLDNITGLAAGRTWQFDAAYFGSDPENVANYEINWSTSALE